MFPSERAQRLACRFSPEPERLGTYQTDLLGGLLSKVNFSYLRRYGGHLKIEKATVVTEISSISFQQTDICQNRTISVEMAVKQN